MCRMYSIGKQLSVCDSWFESMNVVSGSCSSVAYGSLMQLARTCSFVSQLTDVAMHKELIVSINFGPPIPLHDPAGDPTLEADTALSTKIQRLLGHLPFLLGGPPESLAFAIRRCVIAQDTEVWLGVARSAVQKLGMDGQAQVREKCEMCGRRSEEPGDVDA